MRAEKERAPGSASDCFCFHSDNISEVILPPTTLSLSSDHLLEAGDTEVKKQGTCVKTRVIQVISLHTHPRNESPPISKDKREESWDKIHLMSRFVN